MSDSSIEYGYQRLQKVITRYPGDPDRLSKVIILVLILSQIVEQFTNTNYIIKQEILVKRAADLIEQWYSMSSGNHHHFGLPTPPSDHEGETSTCT